MPKLNFEKKLITPMVLNKIKIKKGNLPLMPLNDNCNSHLVVFILLT